VIPITQSDVETGSGENQDLTILLLFLKMTTVFNFLDPSLLEDFLRKSGSKSAYPAQNVKANVSNLSVGCRFECVRQHASAGHSREFLNFRQ
jgi:hypothetical protein